VSLTYQFSLKSFAGAVKAKRAKKEPRHFRTEAFE